MSRSRCSRVLRRSPQVVAAQYFSEPVLKSYRCNAPTWVDCGARVVDRHHGAADATRDGAYAECRVPSATQGMDKDAAALGNSLLRTPLETLGTRRARRKAPLMWSSGRRGDDRGDRRGSRSFLRVDGGRPRWRRNARAPRDQLQAEAYRRTRDRIYACRCKRTLKHTHKYKHERHAQARARAQELASSSTRHGKHDTYQSQTCLE